MPRGRSQNQSSVVLLKEETRMLGAIQMMTAFSLHCLGVIWMYLLVSQLMVFQNSYFPIATLLGYPFWSAAIFNLSGIFAVLAQRTSSRILVTYTIVMHIISAIVASIGVLLISLEILAVSLTPGDFIWVHKSAKLLSEYLLLFSLLELLVAITVTRWAKQAKRR
ncbi:membrane-spanning 4-domains subfamily A member 12 isoform X1 [Oryctolagus cuniculus]|uniref:membrane-spanning 4-domains subfamily A member 12 isoform X1 n=1 Tax=Oryctolagus cuniculus TaxID=9986 RepID=UPI002230EBB1|nr:membrane-spanning 4-domains subfamily A member 6B [Oryctolagus cuniculus]XP_051710622.1 membrane-spanning 4-domains subfamily A member 6B [Oryctolagus cuniculus]XP_051710625.1 membrane-spanning 4-domains subfamily A member 6B [Oryctolagus cuniculus]